MLFPSKQLHNYRMQDNVIIYSIKVVYKRVYKSIAALQAAAENCRHIRLIS